MQFTKLLLAVGLVFTVNQVNAYTPEQPPVQVDFQLGVNKLGNTFAVAKVTGLMDEVKVYDVTMNFGQCKPDTLNPKEATLGHGQTILYRFSDCDDIHDASVNTNYGEWGFGATRY